MSENEKSIRSEIHIAKKITTTTDNIEIAISLLSPKDTIDELLSKAKDLLSSSELISSGETKKKN